MIVRDLEKLVNTRRDVNWGNGKSRRFLLESDGMGYSFTETTVNAGTSSRLEYKNHLETCYCIEGEGEIVSVESEKKYPIKPGVLYALDKHDDHYLTATTDLKLVCVFSPALTGQETHVLTDDASSSCY